MATTRIPSQGLSTKDITRAIKDLIGRDGIFGARFIKANGSVRTGSFRLGVSKGIAVHTQEGSGTVDSGAKYDPEELGLLVVWDMTKGSYRSMYLNRVNQITCRGRTIEKRDDGWYCDGEKIGVV